MTPTTVGASTTTGVGTGTGGRYLALLGSGADTISNTSSCLMGTHVTRPVHHTSVFSLSSSSDRQQRHTRRDYTADPLHPPVTATNSRSLLCSAPNAPVRHETCSVSARASTQRKSRRQSQTTDSTPGMARRHCAGRFDHHPHVRTAPGSYRCTPVAARPHCGPGIDSQSYRQRSTPARR